MYIYAVINIFLNPFLPLSEKLSKNSCSFEPISSFLTATVCCDSLVLINAFFGLEFLVLRLFFLMFSYIHLYQFSMVFSVSVVITIFILFYGILSSVSYIFTP